MVSNEEALLILNRLRENKPDNFYNKVDDIDEGMRYVLIYLSEHSDDVYSTTIANIMKVSRSRVTVLIKKLDAKGLVEKHPSTVDKRIDVLKITDKGITYINELKDDIISTIMKVIDSIGVEDINKFIEIGSKIKNVIKEIEGERL